MNWVLELLSTKTNYFYESAWCMTPLFTAPKSYAMSLLKREI